MKMFRFEWILWTVGIAVIIVLLIVLSAVPVKKGTITCYNQEGRPYFEDVWRDEVKNNGCTFTYISDKTHKQTTVTGPCVVVGD